jgi:hypothetical protein
MEILKKLQTMNYDYKCDFTLRNNPWEGLGTSFFSVHLFFTPIKTQKVSITKNEYIFS